MDAAELEFPDASFDATIILRNNLRIAGTLNASERMFAQLPPIRPHRAQWHICLAKAPDPRHTSLHLAPRALVVNLPHRGNHRHTPALRPPANVARATFCPFNRTHPLPLRHGSASSTSHITPSRYHEPLPNTHHRHISAAKQTRPATDSRRRTTSECCTCNISGSPARAPGCCTCNVLPVQLHNCLFPQGVPGMLHVQRSSRSTPRVPVRPGDRPNVARATFSRPKEVSQGTQGMMQGADVARATFAEHAS